MSSPTRWRARRLSRADPRRNDGNRGCSPDRPTHGLFLMTPEVLHLVGIVGAVTLLLAGFAALVQIDIKRVLAYSTMRPDWLHVPRAYVQAWDAAIFHLTTRSLKRCCSLASGSVISGLPSTNRTSLRWVVCVNLFLVYLCFLVGGAALSALPLVTAGFFSKDEILAVRWRMDISICGGRSGRCVYDLASPSV